jgi:hypothetical protein
LPVDRRELTEQSPNLKMVFGHGLRLGHQCVFRS